jgi:hypothetical protein
MAFVGARAAGENWGSDAGLLFRRGTAGAVANTIVTGFQDAGVEIRDDATLFAKPGAARPRQNVFQTGTGRKRSTARLRECTTMHWYGPPAVEPARDNDCDPDIRHIQH